MLCMMFIIFLSPLIYTSRIYSHFLYILIHLYTIHLIYTYVYIYSNPGAISHNEVLDLYKKHVDPSYTYQNFTVEEQAKILKAGRSNNTLTHDKLVNALPDIKILDIHTSMDLCMQRMKINLEKEGIWPDKLPKRA